MNTDPTNPDDTAPPTILVIEDQATLRANLALLLELEGFRVVTAENGRNGLDSAFRHRPDLVLCDMMMPELNGREVVRSLRADPSFESVPFLFLSAKGEASDLRVARELGADGYLTKPVVREALLGAVRERLAGGRNSAGSAYSGDGEAPEEDNSGNLRESLAVLLSGTDILRHHGGSLTEEERLAQRAAMLEAGERLSEAMKSPPGKES